MKRFILGRRIRRGVPMSERAWRWLMGLVFTGLGAFGLLAAFRKHEYLYDFPSTGASIYIAVVAFAGLIFFHAGYHFLMDRVPGEEWE